MTSIYDIPYEDIQIFLLANNKNIKDKNNSYDVVLELLKDKKAVGHTTSIIEWMMAHNLLINKIDIPIYTTYDIDNMSQIEINKLAKKLTMKSNNPNNIKNILRYLNKLQDDKEFLLTDINDIILNTLTDLEIKAIDISNLNYNDIINLLKTHRNKKEIRKFISDNLEKIIVHNTLPTAYDNLEYILPIVNVYNKNIIINIIKENKEELRNRYGTKEINDVIKEIKENNNDWDEEVDIGENEMYDLVDFTFNLIFIKEIGLAKKVFDIANELHYFGIYYSYNYHLVDKLIASDKIDALVVVVTLMKEDEFLRTFEEILEEEGSYIPNIYEFSLNLLKHKKYDLLINILVSYNSNSDNFMNKDDKTLQNLIESKNDDLILKYIKNHVNK